MYDREQNLSKVAHIGRNHKGDTKLLVTLPITTRLKMLETSEACHVSQQWLVAKGVLYWADLIQLATDLHMSPMDVQLEIISFLSQKAQKAADTVQAAKPAPKATKTARKAEPKESEPKPPKGAEVVKPEPVNPKPRRGTKTAK
jgi:hypothetical protein